MKKKTELEKQRDKIIKAYSIDPLMLNTVDVKNFNYKQMEKQKRLFWKREVFPILKKEAKKLGFTIKDIKEGIGFIRKG